jgi:hypothetical protein
MGLLSSSASVVQYLVKGTIKKPVLETIARGLEHHRIFEIDNKPQDKVIGWTSYKNPYVADFSRSSFSYDPYILFSLRIDKKSIPSKIIQKNFMAEVARRLADGGRQYISRNEKKEIKDQIIMSLNMKIPAAPSIHDIVWFPEKSRLWFFSTLKSANEELETLFLKSFDVALIRLFPYTQAHFMAGFSDNELDKLNQLSPGHFAST